MSTYPVKVKSENGRLIGWTIFQDTVDRMYPRPTDKSIAMLEYEKDVSHDIFSEKEVKEALKKDLETRCGKEERKRYYKNYIKALWEDCYDPLTAKELNELNITDQPMKEVWEKEQNKRQKK